MKTDTKTKELKKLMAIRIILKKKLEQVKTAKNLIALEKVQDLINYYL